jgi:hypothetical protein
MALGTSDDGGRIRRLLETSLTLTGWMTTIGARKDPPTDDDDDEYDDVGYGISYVTSQLSPSGAFVY